MSDFDSMYALQDGVWLACRALVVILFAAAAVALRPGRAMFALASGLEAFATLPHFAIYVLVRTGRLYEVPDMYPDRILYLITASSALFGLAHAGALASVLVLLVRLSGTRGRKSQDA